MIARVLLVLVVFLPNILMANDRMVKPNLISSSYTFPETVALIYGKNKAVPKCSGVLVGASRVLTARHCVEPEDPIMIYFGSNYYPKLGDDLGYRYIRGVASTSVYPVDSDKTSFSLDLAVLELSRPIPAESLRYVLELPSKNLAIRVSNHIQRSKSFYVEGAGFGKSDTRDYPGIKLAFPNEMEKCTQANKIKSGCEPRYEYQTVEGDPNDTCHGDSGGPVFVNFNDEVVLVGIVSRAKKNAELVCGAGGIVSSILNKKILDWINKK